jgi:adenylosuccinate synthase
MVIRAHGGDNAGHTVINPLGEFVLHLVPAGIFNPAATCIIAPGVVVNPVSLLKEMDALEARGVATTGLQVSDRAHMVMPYHLVLERVQESLRGKGAIGTTGRGIGPAYVDKAARVGIQIGELLDPDSFKRRVHVAAESANRFLRSVEHEPEIDGDQIVREYLQIAERLGPYVADVSGRVADAVDRNARILLEGAQATLLDIDHGTYPYVTSSACTVAGLLQGAGIPPRALTRSIGIYKAYTTRVGSGAMPSELRDETGAYLREHAHEFGATTGRARRVGWFDGVLARYTARVNGFDQIALTRLDILDEMDSINVCVGYEVHGQRVDRLPSNHAMHDECQPVLEELPGWRESICDIADFAELPDEAARYVRRIEQLVGAPADIIGVGPARTQTIHRGDLWGRPD